MGVLAALDEAAGQGSTSMPKTSLPTLGTQIAPLSSPVTVQLGGPNTSPSLQGTTFTFTSTQQQSVQALNKAAQQVLNSPNNQTAIIQANTPGISRYIVLSPTAATKAGIQGATSGAVGVQASGSKSIRFNL